MDRRQFLKMIGIASGSSVLAGCDLDRNSEKLIPYLVPPEDGVVPGDATYKPSSCAECPASCGVSVTIKDGRPTKLEGLPSHPVSQGGLCVRGQASLSRLYHPERIRQPLVRDGSGNLVPATWNQAYVRVKSALGSGGENMLLSGKTTGTLSTLVDEFCSGLGVRRLAEFELYSYAAVREANRILFGRPVVPAYHLEKADFLITVGADLLDTYQNPVEYTRQIAHHKTDDHFGWCHVEPTASLTSLQANHHLAARPGSEAYLLACLLRELRARRIISSRRLEEHLTAVPDVNVDDAAARTGLPKEQIENLISGFFSAHQPLVIAGGVSTRTAGGLEVARLAALLQVAAGMIGKTVDFPQEQDDSRVGTMEDIEELAQRLDAGNIGVMFIANADPVSQLPAEFQFGNRLSNAALRVGIGDQLSETIKRCDVILPVSHWLESWGDCRPNPRVVGAIQPAIEPLHDTRSTGEILLQLMGEAAPADSYQIYLLDRWRRRYGASGADGLISKGYLVERSATSASVSLVSRPETYTLQAPPEGNVLVIVPSLRFFDGRSKVLPLLNEIPDPLTSVTWDNWASVSKKTGEELGVKDGDWIEISSGSWSTELPITIQPGMADGVFKVEEGAFTAPAGWDRKTGEAIAVADVTARKIPSRGHLSYLSGSKEVETHGHIPLEHSPHHRHFEEGYEREDLTFFPVPDYPDYRWAMAIDLDACTGCSACVAACYIENNVPVVGREEHLKGREMSWLAIQPYYDYDEAHSAELMPVMCQHCDSAPCEPVCPVFATYHNDEGLNAQVYNRCVGTRYCANNCPYKVRRFNWFDNSKPVEPLNMMFNPDVSVRAQGIMEKCSFCVQRVRKARDVAKDEGRKIGADEVVPACAQSCPGNAIVFGNIKDEDSKVAKAARSEHSHQALDELGTGPAVYYLSRKGNGNEHG